MLTMKKDPVCTIGLVASALESILEDIGSNEKVYRVVYASAENLYSIVDEVADLREVAE